MKYDALVVGGGIAGLTATAYIAKSGRLRSSPLTIEKITGNTHGSLTGWAFTNPYIPAVTQMLKVKTN